MKLTRLTLSGFKSFATQVDLPFDEGVTAIVGPNGCGKSNISDAVRWVLGEQRTRLLRGLRMEDVIFHGSTKRRPVSIADVSLVFDNGDGTLPIAYSTVDVTRRLSRNGQSEYLINQAPVRLRDVQDLLRGTGLGGDTGVVIEASMVDRLLSDRAEERRSLFEEAAGIGLYRDRRTTTERRLEKTGEDLTRLDDLIAEVQSQVRSLARQRGRAERHRQFVDERFAIVMTLARLDLAEIDGQTTALKAERESLVTRLPRAQEALAAAERERETRVQGRATAEARRAEVERRLAAAQVDLGRLDADLTVAAERLEHAATRTTRARGEREEARERAQQAEREREAAGQERSAAQTARQSVQMELDLRAANEEEARARLTAQRERVRELESALQGEAETLRALQGERTAAEREIADVRAQETELAQRLAEAERESRSARTRLEAARAELGVREREQHEAAGELERTRHAFGAAREHEAAVRVAWRSAQEHLAQLEARREALDELERERAGLAPAARQLLQARKSFEPDALLGPLSDFIATSRAGAGLAERLLGDWIHAVLVRDQHVVEAVRRWHAETQPGPLVLLPVTPGPARAAEGTLPAGLEAAAPAEAWARALVAGDAVLDQEGHSIRRSNGSVFLAADGGAGGLIGRRAELDALRAELEGARARTAELEEAVQRATRDHAEAERALAAAGARHERVRSVLHDAQGAHDDATRHLQRAERDRGEADVALARLRQRLEERATRQREIGAEQDVVARERVRLEQELATQRSVLGDLDSAQEAARERRVHWQVEEAQVSAREVAAGDREARADAALAEAREAMARLDQELAEIERERSTLESRRAEWQDQLNERRVSVERLSAAAREAETGVTGVDEALRNAEALVEEARTRLLDQREEAHRLDLAEAEVAARRRALVERIEAEWRKPLDELLEAAPEVAGDPAALREEAERLDQAIEALGPVNALAVEEHSEEAKRLDFLTTQRDDLVQARTSLLQAIREIDATARSMFVTTFASVQENFKNVFTTLFDGGECEVRLSDENDPLSCDIEIRAAPRGKRTQRIHLLSTGERTLVAISLLFAIYLTKPSPFCLLDEVDAPLDDANVARFVRLLNEFKPQTQFIVITHNPRTMQAADAVYGVTMQEPGVSTIVGVRLGEVEPV